MPSTNVTWYSFGFNIVDKQGYLYYGLQGDDSAHQAFLTATELTAIAEIFRDGGQVVFNEINGEYYFVTERQEVTSRVPVEPPAPGHPGPKKGKNEQHSR
jgi:hypothetical protein